MIRWVLVLFWFVWAAGEATAHEIRPAYLEIVQSGEAQFDIAWKQPVLDGRRLALTPVFPEGCEQTSAAVPTVAPGIITERWVISGCDLRTGALAVEGLDRTLTDVFVSLSFEDGEVRNAMLKPMAASLDLSGPDGSPVRAYLRIGIDHILFGPDHLLFVAGLVLLVTVRQVIPVATAFTIAHSLTLAAVALLDISLPGPPVEIMIAASIMFLAVEVIRKQRGVPSLAARKPWLIAFAIGLLHGCGFAGALSEIGLPKGQELLALLLFNLGVEVGQVLFICVLLAFLWVVGRMGRALRAGTELAATYAVGTIGAFWMIERIVG